MNRLYLLGNGFDLAHNLKTSYTDFILDYLKECFEKANHMVYKDELVEISSTYRVSNWSPPKSPKISDFLFALVDENGRHKHKDELGSYYRPFQLRIKHRFFENLLTSCASYNWVNIENEYFKHVKSIFKECNEFNRTGSINKLKSLNSTMRFLIERLDKYFSSINALIDLDDFHALFHEPLIKEEFVNFPLTKAHLTHPQFSMMLNFNYTSTAEPYRKNGNFILNYIHGRAGDQSNPLIFGFGDEMDNDYSAMELNENKGFLKFMKSFGYFKTSNYYNLLRFIESDSFQIVILGHSCGLSDRTLLNMLFEHSNCISIKIFYYKHTNGNNYRELTEEISKHFRDKVSMRRKIVPFDLSKEMPQLK